MIGRVEHILISRSPANFAHSKPPVILESSDGKIMGNKGTEPTTCECRQHMLSTALSKRSSKRKRTYTFSLFFYFVSQMLALILGAVVCEKLKLSHSERGLRFENYLQCWTPFVELPHPILHCRRWNDDKVWSVLADLLEIR